MVIYWQCACRYLQFCSKTERYLISLMCSTLTIDRIPGDIIGKVGICCNFTLKSGLILPHTFKTIFSVLLHSQPVRGRPVTDPEKSPSDGQWWSRGCLQRWLQKAMMTSFGGVCVCVWLADFTAKINTLHYGNVFISLRLMWSGVDARAHANTHADTQVSAATGCCCYWLLQSPQRQWGERERRQRENTEEDELDLYDVLVRMGWGHVGTYESIMNLLCVCVCVCVCVWVL